MVASQQLEPSGVAETAEAGLPEAYAERLRNDIAQMRETIDRLLAEPVDRGVRIDCLYALLHNIRGPAQRAGHDIVTRICALACGILQRHRAPDERILRAVKAHIAALDIIVAHDLSNGGDGDTLGQQMVSQLEGLAAAARG
jgi:hypothetical protein